MTKLHISETLAEEGKDIIAENWADLPPSCLPESSLPLPPTRQEQAE